MPGKGIYGLLLVQQFKEPVQKQARDGSEKSAESGKKTHNGYQKERYREIVPAA